MKNRSYNQFCALAYALDVVGERWTLLIIRELLAGPRRFTDLAAGLPGISTNLLSERLKGLEERGLLGRRVLPPPAGSTVYELTPAGRALRVAVIELGRWGAQFLPAGLNGAALPSVGAIALAIQAFFRPEQAEDLDETYELRLGPERFQVQIKAGALRVHAGAALPAHALFQADMGHFLGLFVGQIDPAEAIAGGLVRVEGDPAALSRFLDCVRPPQPA
ncbi:MAG: winged helix-turn-helix transcriptional regulator [Candidatus Promineifilaceae bacterium]